MEQAPSFSLEWLRALLEERDFRGIRKLLKEAESADVAEVLAKMDLGEKTAIYRLLARTKRAETFVHLPLEQQQDMIKELPDMLVVALLNEMEADDRTRILEDLSPADRNKFLLMLDPEERQVAWQLLSYPEDSVGRLMNPEFLALDENLRVNQALNLVHWSTSLPIEYLNHLFVVDEHGQLIGEVSLASLVVCDPPTRLVHQVMHKSSVFLRPEVDSAEAIEIFRKYDRHYIPVVDQSRKIIGIVSADDVFDLAEEQATEDIQQFGGQGALEEAYLQTPYFTMLFKRVGWLAFLFISAFLTAHTIRGFSDALEKWAFLVFFLPIITSSGGNSGTQAASLVIRGLAINEFSSKEALRILGKEITIGLSLGGILAFIGFLLVSSWDLNPYAKIIIPLSVLSVVLFGVVIGSMLPFLFKAMKLDPAVVSSPFISTIVDLSGVVILFNVAIFVMKLVGLE